MANPREWTEPKQWALRLLASQKLTGTAYLNGEPPPTATQIGAVLHALADHTLLTKLLTFAPEAGEDRANLGDLHRDATGLGRMLQAMGDAATDQSEETPK